MKPLISLKSKERFGPTFSPSRWLRPAPFDPSCDQRWVNPHPAHLQVLRAVHAELQACRDSLGTDPEAEGRQSEAGAL